MFALTSCAQAPPVNLPEVESPAFSDKLERLLNFSVPTIGVQELADAKDQYLILDTREKEEYDISHIPAAKFAGYKNFDWAFLENTPKDQAIVLYCSVGYRSEKIGEKLKDKGFTNVQNLYGSIFEWANADLPLIDGQGKETKKVHTYSGRWAKWVEDGELIKVW